MRPYATYAVEYTSAAWDSIGALGWEDFSGLQRALNAIAEALGASRFSLPVGRTQARVGDFVLTYEVLSTQRIVRLLTLERRDASVGDLRLPGSPAEA